MDVPEVRFAETDGVSIAYQQFGSGPDVVVVPGLFGNVELSWEHDYNRRVMELNASAMRVIQFDKRGMGLSDQFAAPPTLAQRMSDIEAVMDDAGVERASIIGISEGGLMAQLFAATCPERVERVVCANSAPGATLVRELETRDEIKKRFERFGQLIESWGRDARHVIEWFAPSLSNDEAFIRWSGRFQRNSATQDGIRRQLDSMYPLDAYDVLHRIEAETLIVNSSRDQVINPVTGPHLAKHIPNATHVDIDSDNHMFYITDEWLEPCSMVLEFLTGAPPSTQTERAFATVVFTDIVESTRSSATHGDDHWAHLLDEHDRLAWNISDSHGGSIVKSTGDGVLARFAMPSRALDFARDFRDQLFRLGLPIRVGLHTGEIEIRANQDITGFAVNIAARVEQAANDGAIYASSTVRDMSLGGAATFEDKGEHTLKGIDGTWRLYELVD